MATKSEKLKELLKGKLPSGLSFKPTAELSETLHIPLKKLSRILNGNGGDPLDIEIYAICKHFKIDIKEVLDE
jgi:hypothetical protein